MTRVYSEPPPEASGAYAPDRIEALVHRFYGKVREDPALGPVFDARVGDWDVHLARMVAFWRTVLRGEGLYTASRPGGPPAIHRAIDELSTALFVRWLGLFRETAAEVFDAREAAVVIGKAERMAVALSSHLPGSIPRAR